MACIGTLGVLQEIRDWLGCHHTGLDNHWLILSWTSSARSCLRRFFIASH